MLQVTECIRLSISVIFTLLLANSQQNPMDASEKGWTFILTLIAALSTLQYARRWTKGWGSMLVPIPSYHLLNLSDLESSMGRHIGNEMQAILRGDKSLHIEPSPNVFSPTNTPAATAAGEAGKLPSLASQGRMLGGWLGGTMLHLLLPRASPGDELEEAEASEVSSSLRKGSNMEDESEGRNLEAGSLRKSISFTDSLTEILLETSLLEPSEKGLLWDWIPSRHRIKEARLIYSNRDDGYNLHTLLRHSEDELRKLEHKRGHESPSILLVKTGKQEIIGAYTSCGWQRLDSYIGNGESFVFRLRPLPRHWRWVKGKEMMMMLGGSRSLSVGCGSSPALWLDDELKEGHTSSCETFNSSPLVTHELVEQVTYTDPNTHAVRMRQQATFRCVAVELFMLLD